MYFYYRIFLFTVSFVIGCFLALICHDLGKTDVVNNVTSNSIFNSLSYHKWFKSRGLKRLLVPWDDLNYGNKPFNLESNYLFRKVSVLCVILVKSENNVKAAKNTWAKGCTHLELVNLRDDQKKTLPGKRSRDKSSWVLLCNKLLTVNKDSWIVVVHDDTFVILENLRYLVAPLEANEDFYLGHAVSFWGVDYNMGQAGYVLSKGALNRLKQSINHSDSCMKDLTYWNREDFYLGKHLAKLNIHPKDTRDEFGLSTFHPYNWYHAFFPGENYFKLSKYEFKCCSKHSVSFQAIEGDKMYTYNYLFYTLQLFLDGKLGNKPPVNDYPDDKVWQDFLKDRNIPFNISSKGYYKVWEDLIDDPNSFAQNMKREEHSNL